MARNPTLSMLVCTLFPSTTLFRSVSIASLSSSLVIPTSWVAKILGNSFINGVMVVARAYINHKNCNAEYTKMVWIDGGVWMQTYKTVTYRGVDSDGGAELTNASPTTSYFTTASQYNDNIGLIDIAFDDYFSY